MLNPKPDEVTGSKLSIVAIQPLRVPLACISSSTRRDNTDHLSERDHVIVLVDDDPVGIDEHADPVLVGVNSNFRDNMEAEAPTT